MLKQIELPLLDGLDMAHEEDRIIVNLTHHEGIGAPDLAVSVGDAEIVVDYGLSHAHSGKRAEDRPLDDAYDFIYSALQGGVKVEVWDRPDATIERTRTCILIEDRGWEPYTAEAPRPAPSFDDLRPTRGCYLCRRAVDAGESGRLDGSSRLEVVLIGHDQEQLLSFRRATIS